MLKAHNYGEYKLCRKRFWRNFTKILRTAGLKEYLPMDAACFIKEHLWTGASNEATLKFSTWERQTLPQRRDFLPQKDFLCLLIYCNCSHLGIKYFFRCKDFSVHLFARFHFMNTNIYLAMLIFCNYLWVMGSEQLFCAIKFYSNTSEEMQKYYTFKRVFLQQRTHLTR